jgi:amidohydrolase
MNLIDPILALQAQLQQIRRDIHAHPELCYEERRTADVVAEKLIEWGIPVVRGMGITGVVGIIKKGDSARGIGLRADMDALPMQEINQFSHASRHDGKMHACGHDGHTAMLLGAAHYLQHHAQFDGTVYLIFQPAEEGGAGAKRMLEDGLLARCPMQTVYGMHNWPGLETGQFAVKPGPMMASSNEFEVIIEGKGGHAALPHKSIDPVMVAVQIVQAWQTIISRNTNPLDSALLSVTQINAGSTTNVIPDNARLAGTVRTFTLPVLDMVEQRMQEIADYTARAFGAQATFKFRRNYPPLVNHPEQTALAVKVLQDMVGIENVDTQAEPTMGAEDFAYLVQALPGCYVFIGNGDGTHRTEGHGLGPCNLHNASYDFNDDLLPIGASYWVRLVLASLPLSAVLQSA